MTIGLSLTRRFAGRHRSSDLSGRQSVSAGPGALIPQLAAFSAVIIGLVALAGWATDARVLTSLLPTRTPMNPVTALAFVLTGAGILGIRPIGAARVWLVRSCGAGVVLLPILSLSRLYLPWDLGPDRLLFATKVAVHVAGFANRMAPVTGLALALAGLALILGTLQSTRARRSGNVAATIVGLIGLGVIVDYGYQASSLSTLGGFIPVAFNTAVALVLCSLGLLTARSDEGLARLVHSTSVGSMLARRLLPAAVLIPITIGWLELRGTDLGWYDAAGGSALVAIITSLLLVGLIWRSASSANRADDARTQAEAELRELNQTLEVRVEMRTRAVHQSNAELHVEVEARRNAQEDLRRAADELRGWFEASPLAMCSLSADDVVLSWNSAAERLFGWRAADVIGKPLPIISDEMEAESRELTARVLAGQPVTDFETQRRCSDGTAREVSVSTAALYSATGEPRGVVAVYSDIRHRKQLERQLHQSQKMDAIGQLAGGVAHDFNNILTIIQAAAEFLVSDLDEQDVRRTDALAIQVAAQRAAGLTRQLLTFSRQGAAERQDLDVSAVVDRTESMLRRLLEANVELLIQHGSGQGFVNADPNQLEQVIVNLVVNARDAMPKGGRILIETQVKDLDENYTRDHVGTVPGSYVVLSVTDTGVGMSLDTQARIFEPFFTTKAPGKGTGLGLATVYGIVKQFNGHIWLYSEVGKGTTLKVYLPELRVATAGGANSRAVTATAPTPGVRVLLVEDHDTVRRAVHVQLERQGYAVTDAASGDEALALIGDGSDGFDVILSDMMMPGLSGLDLRRRLQEQGSRIPVLLMSGYSETAMKRFGSVDELSPHIEKPFTTESLVRQVEALVRKRSS